jgi:hypothetical protein
MKSYIFTYLACRVNGADLVLAAKGLALVAATGAFVEGTSTVLWSRASCRDFM